MNLLAGVSINGSGGNGTISYIYDATGNKLEKKVTKGRTITRTFYGGNYVYEKVNTNADVLKFLSHPEGYVDFDIDSGGLGLPPDPGGNPWDPVVPAVPDFDYVFQYKDHLGNIRLSYKNIGTAGSPNLEILEENNYYPIGLEHKGYNKDNVGSTNIALKRKFGGNEHQDEIGLDWYDITARNYDPALGRWMNVDPLAEERESISPYNFVQNNPLNRIDPDGRLDNPVYDTDGNFLGTDDRGLQGDAIVMNKGNFSQGMAHSEAKAYDLSPNLGFMNESAKSKMNTHFAGLKDRPDYDGFVTIAEGIKWAKEHPWKS